MIDSERSENEMILSLYVVIYSTESIQVNVIIHVLCVPLLLLTAFLFVRLVSVEVFPY